jgi:hypothetical protein
VFAWIKDKSLYCSVRDRDCAGNCFAYDNDKPRPAVQIETGSRPIAEHALWGDSRWENISASRPASQTWLAPGACVSSNVWLFNISWNYLHCTLYMLHREYQIYSSQKFPSNHSQHSQTSSSMVVLRICKRVERAPFMNKYLGWEVYFLQ